MENIMEVPVNFQAPEEIGILPMDFMKTPDPLSSLSSLAMERKIEIAMNIQAPEDIQISPSGFMKNFKEASQPKRTRRPNCKLTTQILQAHFETTQHPSGLEMAQLAEMTGLTHKQIKAWFSNKRRNTRIKQMREEEEKAKAWQLVAPGSPIPTASPSSIFPKNPIPIEMLIPHIWPKLPLFHPQWLSLWTTYSNVMQTTTVDELIEALARSPPIPDPSPIVKLLQASASSTHTSAALPSIVQLLEASASSVPTSAALPSNSQPKSFDIENLLSQ